jgi:hypothetical protein
MRLETAGIAAAAAAAGLLFGACYYDQRAGISPLVARADAIQYYSDLGPDSIDVSDYPEVQRRNYAVYADVCSRCHGLARSINAPAVGTAYWRFYIFSMRGAGLLSRKPSMTKDDRDAVLSFLEFDAQRRKVARKADFDLQTQALKNRFSRMLEARMEKLQQSQGPRWWVEDQP